MRGKSGGVRPPAEGRLVALAGNPNVGKSTLFNALTGLHQHTGNWPGKTVAAAWGRTVHRGRTFQVVDLPGAYSLDARSAEEEITADFLARGQADAVVVVCDATALERSLIFALQVMERAERVVLCVNLLDEARGHGIRVDLAGLARQLRVPVVGTCAGRREGLEELMAAVERVSHPDSTPRPPHPARSAEQRCVLAQRCAALTVSRERSERLAVQRRADRLLTDPVTGTLALAGLLALVLWLTILGANVPSRLLSRGFALVGEWLRELLRGWGLPGWMVSLAADGLYGVPAWVVSVMLPPMAIFFPLFTLLEELGCLPRMAFLMDPAFQRVGACGKQGLTLCMGLGCNACGVTGCRIIDSPRERLVAMLTNALVPCNGRFPTLISLIGLLLAGTGAANSLAQAALLLGVLLLGVGATLLVSRLLSATVLKGLPSSFVLELPPYRRPRIGQVLIRSLLDRTLFVLGRAVWVAVPAGAVIWLAANVQMEGASLLTHMAALLDPLGRLLGMDGAILLAFLLGWPANELVVPILLMIYLNMGAPADAGDLTALQSVLAGQGWTPLTAVCTVLFTLFHWPCSTTCLTIARETGSLKWTALAVAVPTALGMAVCAAAAALGRLAG